LAQTNTVADDLDVARARAYQRRRRLVLVLRVVLAVFIVGA